MSLRAASPNKENAMVSSGTNKPIVHNENNPDNADSSGIDLFPSVELNGTIVALIYENEEMMQTIASLKKERSEARVRLEQAAKLDAEVAALRAELGYASADTTDTKYRAMNYRKMYEECRVVVERLELEKAENARTLDEAAREKRGNYGAGGAAKADLREGIESCRLVVNSALRWPATADEHARGIFTRLQSGGSARNAIANEADFRVALSQLDQHIGRVGDKAREAAEAPKGGSQADVLLPVLHAAEGMLKTARDILVAYAALKLEEGGGVERQPTATRRTTRK